MNQYTVSALARILACDTRARAMEVENATDLRAGITPRWSGDDFRLISNRLDGLAREVDTYIGPRPEMPS